MMSMSFLDTGRFGTAASRLVTMAAVCLVVSGILPLSVNADEPPEVTHDGLHLVTDSVMAVAWAKPNADFSAFDKIIILEPYVAFQKDWHRDQGRRLSKSDQDQIKANVAREFKSVFVEELETKGGYPIVEEPGFDVMILRPAIIDLIVNATDQFTAGRSSTWVMSSGSAKLYVEIFDSMSGEILARAVDAKAGRRRAGASGFRGGSVTNIADGRAAFREWATLLRNRLDEIHDRFSEDNGEGESKGL